MATALSVLLDAALITMVLALAAFGLAIIYGLIGVINMGHGAFLTLGAYLTWAATQAGVPFVAAVLVAAVGVAIVGLVLEHTIIRHFYDRPFDTLLLTWAFFLVMTELIKIVFGTDFRNVVNPLPGALDLGAVKVPIYRATTALVALVLILGTAFVFYRTALGVKIRALVQNREVASLLGLDIGRMYKMVFAIGAATAGLAGGLISPMLSVDPYIGNVFLVRSFFVVIVGGVGQLLGGTVLGSFFIGGLETVFSLVSKQVFAQAVVFAIAIVILRFRPGGLLRPK